MKAFLTPTLSATSYTNIISVIAIGSNGCKNSNSLTYTVNPVPIINTSFSSGICVGDTSLLTAYGASTYTWNPGNIINNSIVVSPTVSTTYAVIGRSAEGCTNTQSVTVGFSSSSSVNVVASPSTICAGKTTSLVATGNGIIKWYNSDTTTQYLATGLSYNTPTLSAGTHTYYASSTCSGNVRTPVVINVLPIPTITISAS